MTARWRMGSRQRRALKKQLRRGTRATSTTWVANVLGEMVAVVLDGRRKKWREALRSRAPGNPWASHFGMTRGRRTTAKAGPQTPVGPSSGQAVEIRSASIPT